MRKKNAILGMFPMSRKEIAKLLSTSPEAIKAFDEAYAEHILSDESLNHNAVTSLRKFRKENAAAPSDAPNLEDMKRRIVGELLARCEVLSYDGESVSVKTFEQSEPDLELRDVLSVPDEAVRPQLTGKLANRNLNENSARTLLYFYKGWKTGKRPDQRETAYHMFRQGLDLLDLDEITWRILGTNKNAMGYWLPALIAAVQKQSFFRIPKTKIAKVPVTLLQLTRLDYNSVNQTSRDILNGFCMQAFGLDVGGDYFVKTGTFSFKFDFRNAHVTGEENVRTLGEYLLFIQNHACLAAGYLYGRSMYGMSTTNEWVVREYIEDKESNPSIYMGMPLHTEYRAFVDFDEGRVMAITPYWDPGVMKKKFQEGIEQDDPHAAHDSTIYEAHEERLMRRYWDNVGRVEENLKRLIPDIGLEGQWSIDVMQNGDDFWIIDMALAANSALTHCLKKSDIRPITEDWMPKLN